MLKVCLQCEKEFKTYYSAAKYCGRACQFAAQVRAKTYICTNCGKEFQRPNHVIKRDAKNRFCTHECQMQWIKANARVATCLICGKEFKPGSNAINYCSKACRDKGIITQQEYICLHCHKPFMFFASGIKKGRKFCSEECDRVYKVGVNHPSYRGGTWLKHGTRWKKIRKLVLERDKVCRWCKAPKCKDGRSLHIHHINGRRNYLIVDMANELDNLAALCASCHSKVEQAITHGRTSSLPKWLRPR